MAKKLCIQNFTNGATGLAYEAGVEYDVPAATLKANPNYFQDGDGDTDSTEETTEETSEEATEEKSEDTDENKEAETAEDK